jgi:membrane fusion protein (multidrug efflux system)
VAKVSVETSEPTTVLQVPLDGIFERFGSQHVYVVEKGIAQRRPVVLGDVRAGHAEVERGLRAGEVVVSKGVTRVVDGSKVRVVPDDSATASSEETESSGEP